MQGEQIAVGERRAFTRCEVAWRVRLLRESGEHCDAVCTDVGHGGLGFQTQALLRAGEIIDLEFPESGGDGKVPHAAISAQIIYRIGDQYGASFIPAE